MRAIAQCPIPVIAGIGHQRDETLADLVADVCAHTPTAAAEQAVPQLADLCAEHRERVFALKAAINDHLESEETQLQRLRTQLRQIRLDRKLQQEQQSLAWRRQRLIQGSRLKIQQAQQHCQLLKQKLATLDPQAVLQRGYAVVRQENGTIARAAADLTPGQELQIQLGQGQLKVKITEVLNTAIVN